MPAAELFLGIDLGTSGCRAVAVDARAHVHARAAAALPPGSRDQGGRSQQDPEDWWTATRQVLMQLVAALGPARLSGISVDGTSGSLLLTDRQGAPLTPGLMYDDARAGGILAGLENLPEPAAPALAATSSCAKLLWLQGAGLPAAAAHALHQAEWIAGRLIGDFAIGDENNCLKLGYDPVARGWPDWLHRVGVPTHLLPQVVPVGTRIGTVSPAAAATTALPIGLPVFAGTTDSTAAALAAGIERRGDAVTSLGSTLVLKVVADRPVFAAAHGVYSHRLFDWWLAGGASNTGGAVLQRYFSAAEMADLTPRLKPQSLTGLDYYPLLRPGERFPHNDPELPPHIAPIPQDRTVFFQALLEGIARIERRGYRLLQSLGTPAPARVFSSGGGAHNAPWRRIREGLLGTPVLLARHTEAAVGAALIARYGASTG